MGNVLKGAACVVVLSSLAGCGALDPVNMILSARASSYDMVAEMTSPEMRNITLKSLRTADCPTLAGMGPLYQEELKKATAKADRVDIAVAEMNISVVSKFKGKNPVPLLLRCKRKFLHRQRSPALQEDLELPELQPPLPPGLHKVRWTSPSIASRPHSQNRWG